MGLCKVVAPLRARFSSSRRLAEWTPSDAWKDLEDQPERMLCKGEDGESPIQNIYSKSGTLSVKKLNVTSGVYNELYNIPGKLVSNGCDISPVSFWAYCINPDGVLARFGRGGKVRYVAKLGFWSFAGTFGTKQDYFYYIHKTGKLYGVADVDS